VSPPADEAVASAPRIHQLIPPADVLEEAFPPLVRERWRTRPTAELVERLQVICACGPYPTDARRAIELRARRARKAAWEAYLMSSFVRGFFAEERGCDLKQRLASRDKAQFKAAMAECMTCWLLAGRLKLPLTADAPGRNGRNLEMQIVIDGAWTGVEVKSPFRERSTTRAENGDDSAKVAQAMETANRQFSADRPNILVLAPHLRRSMINFRSDLLRAAFGESKITWQVNVQTGESGPVEVQFFSDGHFLNTRKPRGGSLKADGLPGYRRISAILVVEETIAERFPFPNPFALLDKTKRDYLWPIWTRERELHFSRENCVWIDHRVLTVHNPYAYHPLSHTAFELFPQLLPDGNQMRWTDGEPVVV